MTRRSTRILVCEAKSVTVTRSSALSDAVLLIPSCKRPALRKFIRRPAG